MPADLSDSRPPRRKSQQGSRDPSHPSIQPASCPAPPPESRPSSSGLLFGNHSVSVCLISHSIPSLAPRRTLVKLSRPIAPPWPCRPSNTPRHLLPASPRAAASVKDALAQTNKTRHGGNQARCTETGHRGRTRAAHARGLAAAPEQGVYALLNIQRRRTDARRGPLCPAKVRCSPLRQDEIRTGRGGFSVDYLALL